MGDLACNMVLYRPDPDLLATKFRYWQLELLLNQSDDLIHRCLDDFKEYSTLNYEWNLFQADLEIQERKLGLYRRATGKDLFNRDIVAPSGEENTPGEMQEAQDESEVLTLTEPIEEEPAKSGFAADDGVNSSADFRAEDLQLKRDLAAPGQPFALNERRDLALRRLCRDYEEAVDRACVAEEGLRKLYGHAAASSPLPDAAETLGTSITNLWIWIRNAIAWLAGYHQLEQPFTRVVSVRSLLNRNAWALLKHSRDSYCLKLQVPADLFRGHDNCHLRGVGAALLGETGTVPWSMVIRLPEEAVYERSGRSFEVDQSGRPSCLLGKVENRTSVRPMELCGVSSLLNASPIGRPSQKGLWSLEMFKPVGALSESFGHIDDVVLEINAVGIPSATSS